MKKNLIILTLLFTIFTDSGCAPITSILLNYKEKKWKSSFEEGMRFAMEKDFKKAIDSFKNSTEYFPERWVGYYYIGVAYEELGDTNNALSNYRKSMTLGPDQTVPYLKVADIQFKNNMLDEAIDLYLKALSNYKDNQKNEKIALYQKIGKIFKDKGEIEKALLYYEKAFELNKYNIRSHQYLASVYDDIGKKNEALMLYEKAEAIFYTKGFDEQRKEGYFEEIYNRLGDKYREKGILLKALSKYKSSLKLNSENKAAKDAILAVQKEIEESDNIAKEAGKMIVEGSTKDALTKLENALSINSESIIGYLNLGKIFSIKKDMDSTITNYNKGLILDSEYHVASKDNLYVLNLGIADAYFEKGMFEEAALKYLDAVNVKTKQIEESAKAKQTKKSKKEKQIEEPAQDKQTEESIDEAIFDKIAVTYQKMWEVVK